MSARSSRPASAADLGRRAEEACALARSALVAAASACDAAEPGRAFAYRFTAAMLDRHLGVMAGIPSHAVPEMGRPAGAGAASFVATGGRA